MARPVSLSLTVPKRASDISGDITSRTEAQRNSPSPREAIPVNSRKLDPDTPQSPSAEDQPNSPDFTSLPPFPSSPKNGPRHAREPSKGFFSNLKASKSSNKVHQVESTNVQPTIRQVSEDIPRRKDEMNENSIYSLRKSPGSTPDLSLSTTDGSSTEDREVHQPQGHRIPRRPVGTSVLSDSMIVVTTPTETAPGGRKPKPRFGTLLTRTRSTRLDDGGRNSKPITPIHTAGPEIRMQYDGADEDDRHQPGPKTAPLQQDRSLRDMMNSNARNRSADRQPQRDHSQENIPIRRREKAPSGGLSNSSSGGLREGGGSHLFTNIKNNTTKAADGLGKAGKGFFGKIARSGSSNAKEEEPERYVICVINLPLIEQTRRTRIAQRLEDSKDKTEFWMPALPWRCIDYLNFRGCEEEGLYRVPGSDKEIRHWQKRFDQEGDINLFDEPDLYDINIIGSMFKSWLRGLPSEILPKDAQDRISTACQGKREVPKLLKDELSSLPPWNYYLLFAITCHLSLLTAYSDKNKMTYSNLCICFQPALRIDAVCFSFLVQDWRNCWQGCWTEKEALDDEYHILENGLPTNGSGPNSIGDSASSIAVDDRSLASASSHKPSITGRGNQGRPPPLTLSKASEERLVTPTREAQNDSRNGYTESSTQLPELAPMMPLSPFSMTGNV
ncbi:hypothetical protein ABVK25_010586 [Lepraria finkii]|uniref:Rho-GAP domain-containing protein n=1 Tax=Lepraria finkii TaxID=1340010 RepID=A0ABR4AW69_9LECA